MPWFKVDDSFESHPKVKGIPRNKRARAIGLWTLAGSWSARQLTDGFVPTYMLDELACTSADARALVAVGLWIDCDGGFRFNDWHDWQPTREKVEAERSAARERMRAARERKKGTGSADVRANKSEQEAKFGERSGEVRSTPRSVTPTRPDPTRPDPEEEPSRAPRSETPDRFDEFWDVYGKKVKRADAEKKWATAVRKADPDVIIAAAGEYVAWERANNEGGRFIADPSTWLHGERWNDERAARQQPMTRVQEHLTLVQQLAAEEAEQPTLPQIGYRR